MAMNEDAWVTLAIFFALLSAYNYSRVCILELRLEDCKKKK